MLLRLLLALAVSLALPAARVGAAETVEADADAMLYVALVLNGQETDAIVPLRSADGRLLADADALRAAGIRIDGTGPIDLGGQVGWTARYDAGLQRLLLDVPPGLLPLSRLASARPAPAEALADTGVLLGYDAFVQRSGGRVSASLWSEQRLFGAAGMASNTGVLRAGRGARGYLRYDTGVQFADTRRLLNAVAGDVVSGALPWNSPVRIGGIQVARSFAVRPDLVTVPLPQFAGQAAVPSSVDLLVNGAHAGRHDVAPGRFVLDDLPTVNGAGDVTVVTTDAVGRQVATTVRFYVAPELLRPGLTDFSVEAGFLRRGYGRRSFGYGRAVASGTVRHGITPRLTGEGHAELAGGLALGGVGASWSPTRWGAVHAALARSRAGGVTGRQWLAGYSYVGRGVTLAAERVDRDRGFRDLAGFDLATLRGSVRADRVSGSAALGRAGSVGLAYVGSRSAVGARARLVSLSWSNQLGARLSAFASLGYDARGRGVSGQVRLLLPFGRATAGIGMTRDPGRGLTTQASYNRTAASDGGLGLAADAALDRERRLYGQLHANWRSAAMRLEAGGAHAPGGGAVWAGATGALIGMAGDIFPAASVPAAFAVVSTGMAGVPVHYENQRVGVTGRSGALLVPAATAWHPASYAIDTLDLPAGVSAPVVERRAALRGGAGAIIRLPVAAGRSAVARLVDIAGRPLEPGDIAVTADGRVLPIGWDGELMIEDGGDTLQLAVRRRDGSRCHAALTVPAGPAWQHLEDVACR